MTRQWRDVIVIESTKYLQFPIRFEPSQFKIRAASYFHCPLDLKQKLDAQYQAIFNNN